MSFPPHHQYHGFSFHSYDNSEQISPPFFQGGGPIMLAKRSVSFGAIDKCEEEAMNGAEEDLSDNESNLGEKKKRLSMEQVKALEKSFELGNKLEPERKIQLAKALGLQPRQVAIWFQNRRARWKTKQLERDYDALKKQFDSLKADNETLHSHNKKLRAQLIAMKGGDSSEVNDQGSWSENSCDVNVNVRRKNHISSSPASSHLTMNHIFPPQNPNRKEAQIGSLGGIFNMGGEAQALWPWPEQLGSFSTQSHFAHN